MLTVTPVTWSTPQALPLPRLLLLHPLQSILKALQTSLLPGNRPKDRTKAEGFLFYTAGGHLPLSTDFFLFLGAHTPPHDTVSVLSPCATDLLATADL